MGKEKKATGSFLSPWAEAIEASAAESRRRNDKTRFGSDLRRLTLCGVLTLDGPARVAGA